MWQDYVQKVIIPNLAYREDRRDRIIEMLYEYGIEATIWSAIKHDKGELGLVLTMQEIFKWCLDEGLERVLILEDDCEILTNPYDFHFTFNKCCDDLKDVNWDLFYLGVQQPMVFDKWVTQNLLPVTMGFSTHALLYSKKAMEFVVGSTILEPIDNYLVKHFQKYNTSFCSYPMLCSQVEGYSDIGEQHTSWKKHLEGSFYNFVRDIIPKRFKQ